VLVVVAVLALMERSTAGAVSAPEEDPVAVEMRRITEQLRE